MGTLNVLSPHKKNEGTIMNLRHKKTHENLTRLSLSGDRITDI